MNTLGPAGAVVRGGALQKDLTATALSGPPHLVGREGPWRKEKCEGLTRGNETAAPNSKLDENCP